MIDIQIPRYHDRVILVQHMAGICGYEGLGRSGFLTYWQWLLSPRYFDLPNLVHGAIVEL